MTDTNEDNCCSENSAQLHVAIIGSGSGAFACAIKAAEGGDGANANVDTHGEAAVEMHSYIGIALVFGFIFMLLVDQIGGRHQHVSAAGHIIMS